MRLLFLVLRILGDVRAIRRGRYHKRLWNRRVMSFTRRRFFWR